MKFSICTTNYNCGHALPAHLRSVYDQLAGLDFEYVMVDNRSQDASWSILSSWATHHSNMMLLSRRSTMGEGRQLAFRRSSGGHILVLDTDVVYSNLLRRFVDAYFEKCPHLSVQAIFCGMFPRDQWERSGGRRSLNTNEDVDLWLRLLALGSMQWYPIAVGENMKEASAWGMSDYLSRRYSKRERLFRLLRREWDLLKTSRARQADLQALVSAKTIDLGLGARVGPWPQSRVRQTPVQHVVGFLREFKQAVQTP